MDCNIAAPFVDRGEVTTVMFQTGFMQHGKWFRVGSDIAACRDDHRGQTGVLPKPSLGAVPIRPSMSRILVTNRRPVGYVRSKPQPQVGHCESGSRSSTPGAVFAASTGIAVVMHNNIEFLVQEGDAGAWRWEYTIGELIKSGEFVVSSRKIAARKVRQKIDRDLRMQYLSQRERGIRI
jgi:hypothetical protein